jgi:nucleoid DNA-binding protein
MVAKKKAAAKKKPAAKKAVRKKVAPKAAAKKITAIKEPMSKSALFATIAENTDVARKDVAAVFAELEAIIDGHIRKRGAGTFNLPGLLKITTVKKPARKARKGINPFTGEETMFKAKPASTVVKVRPLKKLKDFVNN